MSLRFYYDPQYPDESCDFWDALRDTLPENFVWGEKLPLLDEIREDLISLDVSCRDLCEIQPHRAKRYQDQYATELAKLEARVMALNLPDVKQLSPAGENSSPRPPIQGASSLDAPEIDTSRTGAHVAPDRGEKSQPVNEI